MGNNSTNINKMNSHHLFKSIKYKTTRTYEVGHTGTDLEQVHKYGGVKPINVIQSLNLDNSICND